MRIHLDDIPTAHVHQFSGMNGERYIALLTDGTIFLPGYDAHAARNARQLARSLIAAADQIDRDLGVLSSVVTVGLVPVGEQP